MLHPHIEKSINNTELCEILQVQSIKLIINNATINNFNVNIINVNDKLCPRCRRFSIIDNEDICNRCEEVLTVKK